MVQITSALLVAVCASTAVLAMPAPPRKGRSVGATLRRVGHGAERGLNAAGNVAGVVSAAQGFTREFYEDLEVREPKRKAGGKRKVKGAKRAAIKKAGRGAGRALDAAGNAASVLSVAQSLTGREFDDDNLEVREPKRKAPKPKRKPTALRAPKVKGKKRAAAKKAGRGAERALDAAGNAAGIISAAQGFVGRDFDDEWIEVREPKRKAPKPKPKPAALRAPKVKGTKRAAAKKAGRGAERALDAAGNAAGIISAAQGFVGREFDDFEEMDARDFYESYDELD